MKVLLGQEFLDGIDCDGLVDGAAGAGVLAPAVAYAAADCRERILALDQFKRLAVLALGGLFQISLHRNVRGASCLAGGCACRIAVYTVTVAIVLIPFMRSPLGGVGKFLLGIYLLAVLGAKFLAKFDCSGRTILHAPSAGYAVLGVHLGNVCTAAHVGRIEQLGRTQCIAYLYVAIANGENLALAVNIGNLVYEAVVFRLAQYGHCLLVCNVVTASGLTQIVCHVAHAYAPVTIVVRAAFVQFLAAVAARTDTDADMALVFFEPVRNMLDINRLVLHTDSLFDRNNMHAYTRAAQGHHGRYFFKREESHAFKKHRKLGMLVHKGRVHVGVLGTARHKHRNPVNAVFPIVSGAGNGTLGGVFVAVIVLEHSKIGQFVEQVVK